MKRTLLCLIILLSATEAFAKKDFKGLFGSYRRDKFTENEGKSSDFGMDVMLSTLLPVSSMVKSVETRGGSAADLSYSTFFNVEASFFVTLNYHWELFTNIGYYTYDTRKENALTRDSANLAATPIFHQFELTSYPVILGVKYRLSREDIVPYIGAGAGFAFCKRKGSYDNDPTGAKTDTDSQSVLAAQATVGLEFFFDSRAGIRLEMSGMYIGLPERTYDYGRGSGSVAINPILVYQKNPWTVRYASGLFFLF